MRLEGFVIHLARAEQRRPQVETLRDTLPMPVHVVEAVDGRAMTPDEIASVYRPRLYRPRYPFALGPGEIGCFLSHRRVWREIVERNLDAGLIVEDDVAVDTASLGRLLDLVATAAGPEDFVRFPQKERGEAGPVVARGESGALLIEPVTPAFGTVMQIGGAAARADGNVRPACRRPFADALAARCAHPVGAAAGDGGNQPGTGRHARAVGPARPARHHEAGNPAPALSRRRQAAEQAAPHLLTSG
jgi:hypothetical protein